ncbi:Ger(x)C family spore germination protein [Clostridium minihomine]|uniref:Ger(x)C family spore germination protein n=1 Tax=Clostridium minihomine TaxID=2045012 RepID=UPI001FB48CE2|nr:Ger(x)C family spore germination protein [Clostridium minihomine]
MKKFISVLLSICLLIPMTGCWNYRGLNEMTIVAGIAVDKSENQYNVAFEIMDLQKPTKIQGPTATVVFSQGATLLDAVRNAKKQLSSKLYFGNTQVIIISQSIAREDGLHAIIDFLLRDAEMRENIDLVISQEPMAQDLILLTGKTSGAVSYDIVRIVREDNRIVSSTISTPLYLVYNKLEEPGFSIGLPVFFSPSEPNTDIHHVEANGIAVFRQDKLVGFLSPHESKYLLMADRPLQGGVLALYIPKVTPHNISLEISDTSVSRSYQYENGSLSMKLDITVNAYLAEYPHKGSNLDFPPIAEISESAENLVVENVKTGLKRSQTEFNADVLGLGNYIYRTNLPLWKTLENNWDEIYQTLPIEVNANVHILNTAMIRQN